MNPNKILAHLQGVLLNTIYHAGKIEKIIHQSTWRAHCGVTGRSKADKKRSMQLKVKEWFNINVTDDEADAIGLGKCAADTSSMGQHMEDWE